MTSSKFAQHKPIPSAANRNAGLSDSVLLDAIYQGSNQVFLLVDEDYKILYFNRKTQEVCNIYLNVNIEVNNSILPLVPRKSINDFQVNFRNCLSGKQHSETKELYNQSGDKKLWFEISYMPVRDSHGKIFAVSLNLTEVTQKTLLEQTLRESSENLRRIIDLVPQHISVKNVDGEFLLANKAVAESFGQTIDSIVGKNQWDISAYNEETRRFNYDDRSVIESNKQLHIEEQIFTDVEGNRHIFETTKVPLLYNQIPAVLVISQDITALKKTRESISYLATILDNTEDHATIKDLSLRIIGANKAMIEASGFQTIDEIMGKTDLEVYGDYPHVHQYIENELKAQKLNKGECLMDDELFVYPDGRRIISQVRKFPIYDLEGKLVATANISRDITHLKEIENALKISEQRYRDLIESQGEGACLVDVNECIVYANPAASHIFDIPHQELLGKSLSFFMSPASFERMKSETKIRKTGLGSTYELEIILPSGKRKDIIVTASPHYDSEGIFIGTFGVFRDITERLHMETTLKESRLQLIEMNATKDKFFSIIAHDLKNPFGSIMGFADLIIRRIDRIDKEKILVYAGYIKNVSRQGFDLLENLLEWSRAQTGRIKYDPSTVLVNELVEHNICVLNNISYRKNIFIRSELAAEATVFVDEDMINTVLRNLLSNAIKFSEKGSEVIVRTQLKSNFVQIDVVDTGTGIETTDLGKLFRIEEGFSRPGTEREEGTGLGLILCKEFVDKNGGKIWVDSIPGKGSCFSFTIPVYTGVK